ncbi:hypothetical protein D9756_007515 [Leucocoprinus leucothites]|uniref:Tetraspanin n=1 Tax=Leucocoprinus leucothites TaxID=201217 RepID=A0A8H5D329_9AGAR|nr:hypothetical protein D9756_007515 [Leucoagaricus leucothites]
MSPKFCCCLPLRFGTLVISLIQFILCGLAAGAFWYLLWLTKEQGWYETLQTSSKIAFIVAGAVYTFAAVIGLFGFIGAIFKKNGLVRTYLALLYVTLLLQIASGIYSLVMFYRFRNHPGAKGDCTEFFDNSTNSTVTNYCDALNNFSKLPVWSIWVSAIVPIVVVAYACYVVHNYARRLAKQRADREIIATRSLATGPEYTAVKPHEETHPLTQPTYNYPYSDAPNSFGNATSPPATGHAANYYYSENKV